MKKAIINTVSLIMILFMLFKFSPVKADVLTIENDHPEKTSIANDDLIEIMKTAIYTVERKSEIKSDLFVPEYPTEINKLDKNSPKREYGPPTEEELALTAQQVRSFDCSTVTDVPEIECDALVALYESTNGASWHDKANWLISTQISDWYGVVVQDNHVVSIDLKYNRLSGPLTEELQNLIKLKYLDLHDNYFLEGNIPHGLGNLLELEYLNLKHNRFSGNIPSEIGNLIKLKYLDLSWMRYQNFSGLYLGGLYGSIPSTIGNLSDLQYLDLGANCLGSTLPSSLGNLVKLQYLDLSFNRYTAYPAHTCYGIGGNIPSSFGNLIDLQELILKSNNLSGEIPSELGNLRNLTKLFLSWNNFTGPIPLSFINLTDLDVLNFDETSICELITTEFITWKETVSIWIGTGVFCDEDPYCLSVTDISQSECEALASVYHHTNGPDWYEGSNWLKNTIAGEWFGVTVQNGHVTQLDLLDNGLVGQIPSSIGNLTDIKYINIGSNQLSGSLPPEIGDLTKMQSLLLSSNLFTGSVPINFINLIYLEYFNFQNNDLCEPSTSEFQVWKATVEVWLGTGIICESQTPWLLMYYIAGDNDLNNTFMTEWTDIRETKNSNIDIAIFFDTAVSETSYEFIPSQGEREVIYYDELNSGEGQTLIDFINWAKSKSNASNVALILSDHGHALMGFGLDETSSDDKIYVNDELPQALADAGPFDVIYMHACLMANLEFLYQIRGSTDYFVGHESIGWAAISHSKYLSTITSKTTPRELALNMANAYYDEMSDTLCPDGSCKAPSVISTFDMSYLYEVVMKTNDLALAILNSSPTTKLDIWNVSLTNSSSLQRFDDSSDFNNVNDHNDLLADLYHFAELLLDISEIQSQAQSLLSTHSNFVIFNDFQSGYPQCETSYWDLENSKGISIVLPSGPISFYKVAWLYFAQGTDWSFLNRSDGVEITAVDDLSWGPMISELVELYNPNGDDRPDPPDLVAPLIISKSDHSIYLPLIIK